MEQVGIRELRNQVAALVRRAGAGERIVVAVDGVPVAQLGPLSPDTKGISLADQAAAGLVEPPRRPDRDGGGPPALDPPVDVRVDRVVDDLRGR